MYLYINKIIRNVKSTKNCIKLPCLDLKTLQLKLFTDASFHNFLNGGSQGGQIIFITNGKSNSCPLHWNSSKIERVVLSIKAAETLSLADGCHVAIYINNLLSELLRTEPNCLSITAYILWPCAHMKQTMEKHLLLHITAIQKMVERNEITVTWINKEKQLSDVLTKSGAPSNSMLQKLNIS